MSCDRLITNQRIEGWDITSGITEKNAHFAVQIVSLHHSAFLFAKR